MAECAPSETPPTDPMRSMTVFRSTAFFGSHLSQPAVQRLSLSLPVPLP